MKDTAAQSNALDPYGVLGVKPTATQDEIRKAYRSLAKKLHPDLNPGNEEANERFKLITAAYDQVGTEESRKKFEEAKAEQQAYESASRTYRGPSFRETQESGGRYTRAFDEDLQGAFAQFFTGQGFGGTGQSSKARRGRDQLFSMPISLEQSILGGVQRITLPSGKVLDVKIPSDVTTGKILKFKGLGDAAPIDGGEPGDVLVELQVRPSETFQVHGEDLHLEVPISIGEAVLGGKVPIASIEGIVNLTIPKGTSSGKKFRLKGRGMPKGKDRGDLIVTVSIVLPSQEDTDLEAAITEWSKGHHYNPRST